MVFHWLSEWLQPASEAGRISHLNEEHWKTLTLGDIIVWILLIPFSNQSCALNLSINCQTSSLACTGKGTGKTGCKHFILRLIAIMWDEIGWTISSNYVVCLLVLFFPKCVCYFGIKAYLVAKIKSNVDKNWVMTWYMMMLRLYDTQHYLFKPEALGVMHCSWWTQDLTT